jgi:hypothetical protein
MADQTKFSFNANMKKKLDAYLKHMITVDIITTLNTFGMDPELNKDATTALRYYLK